MATGMLMGHGRLIPEINEIGCLDLSEVNPRLTKHRNVGYLGASYNLNTKILFLCFA